MIKLLFSFLLFVATAQAIVTIAPADIGDKPGVSGILKGSFETQRGNSDVESYNSGLRVQYDNNKSYLIWSDLTFAYGKSSGKTNTNKKYAHIRYIHHLYEKTVDWEAFLQAQTNEFTNTKERYLSGAGVRLLINQKNFGKLHFGLGAYVEHIAYTTIDPTENDTRINSYIAYKKSFQNQSSLSYVLYYQPKVDAINDYLLSSALEFNILIYKQLYLNFLIDYNYNATPVEGIKPEDVSQKTSLIYKF